MSDNPMTEAPSAKRDDQERKFGATECFVESNPTSRTEQGLVLMAVGLLGMVVGVMGLLGMNVFDRDRR